MWIDDGLIDDSLADGRGDMSLEKEGGDEIEEGGPQNGQTRREHAGRNDGGHRIGRVIEPIGEIENKGDRNDDNDVGDHARVLRRS